MRMVVLGANGQLGSDLVRAAQADSAHVEVEPVYRRGLDVSNIESIPAFLAQRSFDVLVNCTSYHKTDEVEQNASKAFLVNAHAVKALAKACRTQRARLVHISTDYVFGGDASLPYRETDPPSPLNVYGASKLMGENLAKAEYPDGVLILRVASLFGVEGASGKGGNFVETMLRVAKEKGQVRVVNDITMSPTATHDVAKLILNLLEKRAPACIYHTVNSGHATWFEFARRIIQRAAVPAEVVPVSSEAFPTVAMRPSYSVLDNGKVATIAGPIPSWEDALERYLQAKGHVRKSPAMLL